MEEEALDGVDNLEDLGSSKHPCSKIFVRTMAILTCLHMITRPRWTAEESELFRCRTLSFIRSCPPNPELDQYASPDGDDVAHYVLQWTLFGSFPILSLLAIFITGVLMKFWPRISETMYLNPTLMHVLCLFSLFYMVLESMFQSFSYMYSISSSSNGMNAPWGSYLMSSLYTLLLWFFLLNFLVNMQLTEFDCRMAREVAGALHDDHAAIAD
ncbi:hypothetical protein Q1695_009150 [Nippostrongylus brasiliensis]|nr:hypothetical protein Q1695_009150 [Nippostrongylus brasiliensis]